MDSIHLIIHVGLPKTATTSLQNNWAGCDNYVGLGSQYSYFTHELLRIFFKSSKGSGVENDIRKWVEKLLEWRGEKIENPIILSDEHFFGGEFNGNSEFPILLGSEKKTLGPVLASFMKTLAETDGPCDVNVQAIMTIRNQPDWIGSKYAQASPKIFRPSQEDFERRVVKFSQRPDRTWCDWSVWIKSLDAALGKSQVHVFCLEEMTAHAFWDRLNTLCGLSRAYSTRAELSHLNKKSAGANEWSLGGFSLGGYVSKRMKAFPGGKLEWACLKGAAGLNRLGMSNLLSSKATIRTTDIIRNAINDTCGEGNAWLERRLGKDLSQLGYPVARED